MAFVFQASVVVGGTHTDTVPFDDVATYGLQHDARIIKIGLFYDHHSVVGLSIFYDRTGGRLKCLHLGSHTGHKEKTMFHLEHGEHIVHVSGKSDNVITRLVLRTDRGKAVEVGGHNGHFFDLNVPLGYHVHGFKGGVGSHLHNLGAIVKPNGGSSYPTPTPSYPTPIPPPPPSYPPSSYPPSSYPPPPSSYPPSSYPPSSYPPSSYPPPPPSYPTPTYSAVPSYPSSGYVEPHGHQHHGHPHGHHHHGLELIRSVTVGRTHGDTRPFDDFSFISGQGDLRNVRISEVHCIFGDSIVGLHVVYHINGMRIPGPTNYGTEAGRPGFATGKFELHHDDHIVEISGSSGHLIDRIYIKTARGKTVNWGGQGGIPFSLNIPHSKRVIAISGGVGGHLHNLSVFSV